MEQMPLWVPGEVDRQLDNIEPLLDNWNGKNDAGKQKLERYLEKLKEDLGPLPADERDLFLHMDIAGPPEHYLNQHDLDNYLTPVAKKLGAEYFVLVSGRKHVGGVSRLIIGRAQPGEAMGEDRDWMHATIDPILMSAQHPDWKAKVRERLLSQQPSQLPPGPVKYTSHGGMPPYGVGHPCGSQLSTQWGLSWGSRTRHLPLPPTMVGLSRWGCIFCEIRRWG